MTARFLEEKRTSRESTASLHREAEIPLSVPNDPKQRLLEAAIQEIESRGLARVTVRGIAAAAGANIAAVSYYFCSKEALIAEAKKQAIRGVVDDCEKMLEKMSRAPEAGLTTLLKFLLKGALTFPRLSRAQLHDAFVSDDYSGPLHRLLAPLMERLREELRVAVPSLDKDEATRRVIAAVSGVFFPGCFTEFFSRLHALETDEDVAAYCRHLSKEALAPVRSTGRGANPRLKRQG
jgi:TetR/AcrR family transcriptional regulator, regulator of cefoperazone and chloramphenicol sensitivity